MIFSVHGSCFSRIRTKIKNLFPRLFLNANSKSLCVLTYIFLNSGCRDIRLGHFLAGVLEFESLMHCRSPLFGAHE